MSMTFEPVEIKGIRMRNRIVRSALYEGVGTYTSEPGKNLARLYNTYSDGQIGLIITSAALIERFKVPFPLRQIQYVNR